MSEKVVKDLEVRRRLTGSAPVPVSRPVTRSQKSKVDGGSGDKMDGKLIDDDGIMGDDEEDRLALIAPTSHNNSNNLKHSNSNNSSDNKKSIKLAQRNNSINGEINFGDYDEDVDEDDDEIEVSFDRVKTRSEETFWSITIQVFIPFIIAGIGMVGAGLLLDVVQHWPVFMKVPEVFILVPALLGLKGNLEMTLASRLSTEANLGHLDTPKSQWNMALGNLSLVQCQSIVIGFLASIAAVILGWIPDGHFNVNHALVLCTSAVMTASLASFCLGVIMVLVVLLSKHFRINPDNVATPIAASLGDLTTLSLLAFISNSIYNAIEMHAWIASAILIGYVLSMPIWISIAKRNKSIEKILYTGWTPVLSAMVISSFGGLILVGTVKVFTGVAVFQPVLCGVGGNLVAVQASRISTSLHCESELGTLPESIPRLCSNPIHVFFSKGGHAMAARALILMVVPGHLIFVYTISFVQAGHTSITIVFLVFYLLAALIQVIVLLYIAEVLVQFLWLRSVDPDNASIPYLTSLGDLIGTGLLAMAFLMLDFIGDGDSDVGD